MTALDTECLFFWIFFLQICTLLNTNDNFSENGKNRSLNKAELQNLSVKPTKTGKRKIKGKWLRSSQKKLYSSELTLEEILLLIEGREMLDKGD